MPRIRSIAILLHERDRGAPSKGYRLWALAENWRARGIKVRLIHGAARDIDADLLIPHLDLSCIPDDYWEAIQAHPNVVNRGVRDIRKRRVSVNLIGPDDAYDGPVIVKTDRNCGGFSDLALLESTRGVARLLRRARTRLTRSAAVERRVLGGARVLSHYHLFDSVRLVPRRVFANPHLVVEKFLPERRGERFAVRYFNVFGDQYRVRVLESADPQAKSWNGVLTDRLEPPADLVAWCQRFGLTFGKIDYVVRDGQGVVIDVNTTPAMSGPINAGHVERSADLAKGLAYFEAQAR